MKLMSLLLVAIAFFTACEKGENHIPTCVGLEDSTVFEIKYGQEKQLCTDNNSCLSFTKVVSDSRCPSDVICVWQGTATIELSTCNGSEGSITLEIYHPIDYAINGVNYTIELTGLNPYPSASHPHETSEYVAAITVKKK